VVWNIRYEPGGGFAYRVADETCAPRARRCPERILRTLSDPAPSDAAARWREACWGRIITRQARPPLSDGDRIRLLQPQRFSDGVLRDEFTALRIGRTWRFESDDGAICRFDVKALDYEVIGAGAGGFDPARDA